MGNNRAQKRMACVVLAAGEGTRMRSRYPKVLHKVCGVPLLGHVLNNVEALGVKKTIVVAGFKRELVEDFARSRATIVNQRERRGSGHALSQSAGSLRSFEGGLLVLYGDTPLLEKDSIKRLIKTFEHEDADCALLSAKLEDPTGYGRVIRKGSGHVEAIIEELNASHAEKALKEINVGAYCFKKKVLFEALSKLKPDKKKSEYYLTDAVIAIAKTGKVIPVQASSSSEAFGINSRKDLSKADELMRRRVLHRLMMSGVTIKGVESVHVDSNVEIGEDTVIYPNTVIQGPAVIGKNCSIGPFAHIRSGVKLQDDVTIGNFVEVTRSKIGKRTFVKHLSYLGDTELGDDVNIGAGTITANFDGKQKHRTVIEKGSHVGSGTVFVAPVRMGRSSKTGAGAIVKRGTKIPSGSTVVGVPARVLSRG